MRRALWVWLLSLPLAAAANPYSAAAPELQTPTLVPNPALDRAHSVETFWNPEGQEFSVYGLARDALVGALGAAKNRVILASPFLADGDVATALLMARLRGLKVRVLLDTPRTSGYLSRHSYLADNKVETLLKPLKVLHGWTVVTIDDFVWEFSAALDDRVRGAVRLVPSPREAAEVEGWFGAAKILAARPAPLSPAGAKNPTKRRSLPESSATLEERKTVVRRSHRSRGLPRETRLQLLESGALRQEPEGRAKQGSAAAALRGPEVSSREAELP